MQANNVTAAEFAAKYRSKREVYRFLANDVRAYVPSYETVTVWHLRDIASGARQLIKCTDMKVMQLPHYEGLTVEDLLEYA